MALNNNIFCATNPARITEALWRVMCESGVDVADMLIFLPSRRAVRTVEKMIAEKFGGVVILPTLIALGEGVGDELDDEFNGCDVIPNMERVVVLARLLAEDANVGNLTAALPIAQDLVRMQDYLENEGVNAADVDWAELVDEKYAAHFMSKARILSVLSNFMPMYAQRRITATAARNRDIRAWENVLENYKLVVVCASTASVPATADLMEKIAGLPQGRIILSGKIAGREQDFVLNTNPYNSEYKFLKRLGLSAADVVSIDVGKSVIDFMNHAFSNDCTSNDVDENLLNCNLIEVPREATEADVVAEIAVRAVADKKSVLVITPDAAGNQRIAMALCKRGIVADFSGGMSGAMTNAGRAILNLMDLWIETGCADFDMIYQEMSGDLFDTIAKIVHDNMAIFTPQFIVDDAASVQIWLAIKDLSDALNVAGIRLSLPDARAFVFYAMSGVSVRGTMNDEADVVVLGTIESRMQTADVVILTGLNDGMFPARGYENAWLPRTIAEKIGLPSPDRKVSLQSLDFMNLSCGDSVYWIRSLQSGGVQTTESRFISRVIARAGEFNWDAGILTTVLACDNVPHKSLDYSVPTPPNDWSDVYVTALELLIHNPYAFYVRHILKLHVLDDYWVGVDVRDFGNLVHDVVEKATDLRPDVLVAEMDRRALEKLGRGSVIFHFWHKRFLEIAPIIANELSSVSRAYAEIGGVVNIAGRNVRARADRIWDGGVLDIKTGAAPTRSQLEQGNMLQLPLEAYILQSAGFPIQTTDKSRTPIMRFLQLKNNDARVIEYDSDTTRDMMNAAVAKVTELFNIYSAGGAGYEYRETGDQKYKVYDDLARIKD